MSDPDKQSFEVYRIVDRASGKFVGSYSRAYRDEYDFSCVDSARDANVNGLFRDKARYSINRYRVIYELVDRDVDGDAS